MALSAVVAAFETRLATWSRIGDCPLFESNVKSRTPGDGSPYLMLQFPFSTGGRISFGVPGANVWREDGAARVLIHVARGSGTDNAHLWADEIASLFRGKRFDGVETFAPSSANSDDSNENGAYFVVAIAIPYRFDLTG